jgi:glycosyltransferase involved in cell wall biosynthesis
MRTVSVVIPVYRTELTLRELHRQLVPVMESLTDAFEIVFVEDCGTGGRGSQRSWHSPGSQRLN